MIGERVALSVFVVGLVACSHREPRATAPEPHVGARERELSRLQVAQRARRLELRLTHDEAFAAADAQPFRLVGADDGPVPGFDLATPSGARYRSQELVGREAFVTVFFATWCDYCSVELDLLARAIDEVGPMLVIPVSADDGDTWHRVPEYLAKHGIRQPAVRAKDYPRFSVAYDPFDTVPVVVIVGRDGGLVDYHLGYDPAYASRLTASLRLAQGSGRTGADERASARD